jgi:hypothetical protein
MSSITFFISTKTKTNTKLHKNDRSTNIINLKLFRGHDHRIDDIDQKNEYLEAQHRLYTAF